MQYPNGSKERITKEFEVSRGSIPNTSFKVVNNYPILEVYSVTKKITKVKDSIINANVQNTYIDYDNNGQVGFVIGFTGDQRASGWGGAGNVQAPVSVIINSNTFTIASSGVPNGYYNGGYTYWSWSTQAGLSNGSFTFQVSIY